MESVIRKNVNILGLLCVKKVEPVVYTFIIHFENKLSVKQFTVVTFIHFFENINFNENGEVHTFPGTVSQLERAMEMIRSRNGTFGLRHSLDW